MRNKKGTLLYSFWTFWQIYLALSLYNFLWVVHGANFDNEQSEEKLLSRMPLTFQEVSLTSLNCDIILTVGLLMEFFSSGPHRLIHLKRTSTNLSLKWNQGDSCTPEGNRILKPIACWIHTETNRYLVERWVWFHYLIIHDRIFEFKRFSVGTTFENGTSIELSCQ